MRESIMVEKTHGVGTAENSHVKAEGGGEAH